MRWQSFIILALLALAATQASSQPNEAAEAATDPGDRIVFAVEGFKNNKGSLRCGLFGEDSWLGKSQQSAEAKIEDGKATCEFLDVPAGTYGISSYHDKNDNGKLDLGMMRIPKEAFAASNNARGSFGPPKFEDAKFSYEGGLLELAAEIR